MKYKYLEKFLEGYFIPNNIRFREISNNGIDVEYEKYIDSYSISNLKLNDYEKAFIVDYLKDKGISVRGRADKINFESDNYIEVKGYKGGTSPESLSKEETLEKFKLYKETGDVKIRDEIILGNMRLVISTLQKMHYDYNVSAYDLRQAGYEALINAVDRFDLDRGLAFSTYAVYYIMGYIKREMHMLQSVKPADEMIYKIMKDYENEVGESIVENPLIAEKVLDKVFEKGIKSSNRKEDNLRRIMFLNMESLDEILDNDENENIYDLGYDMEDNDYNYIYDEESFEIIREAIKSLDEDKQKILALRFGLDNNNSHTYAEIGKELGMSGYGANLKVRSACNELLNKDKVRSLKSYCYKEI